MYIGTLDSFMWNTCSKLPRNARDFFVDVARSIADGNIRMSSVDGSVHFKGSRVSALALVAVDEAQDMHPAHGAALIDAIQRQTGSEVMLVGDQLQCLTFEDNALQRLVDGKMPGVRVLSVANDNICRRFHHPTLHTYVNAVVRHSVVKRPPIKHGCNKPDCPLCAEPNDDNPVYVGLRVSHIAAEIVRLAKERRYKPCDFAVVSAFVKNQDKLAELETDINQAWLDLGADEGYRRDVIAQDARKPWGEHGERWSDGVHCRLHQSEEDRPIDLAKSEHATPILSIHAAKGGGWRIVFLANVTEERLRSFAPKGPWSAQYESLINVAMTRMMKRLYVAYVDAPKQDDLYIRFTGLKGVRDSDSLVPQPIVLRDALSTRALAGMLVVDPDDAAEAAIARVCDAVQRAMRLSARDASSDGARRLLVDDEHHDMRAMALHYTLVSQFVCQSKQLRAVTNKLTQLQGSTLLMPTAYWARVKQFRPAASSAGLPPRFPVLGCRDEGTYAWCASTLQALVADVLVKLRRRRCSDTLPDMCPLEMHVFLHMLEVVQHGKSTSFRPMALYDTLRAYMNDGLSQQRAHTSCKCAERFRCTATPQDSLTDFHDGVAAAKQLYEHLRLGKHVGETLFDHRVYCESPFETAMFTDTPFISQAPDGAVVIVHVYPALTTLNVMNVVTKAMLDAVCVWSARPHLNPVQGRASNRERYAGKPQRHFVLALNHAKPVPIEVEPAESLLLGVVWERMRAQWMAFRDEVVAFRNASEEVEFERWSGEIDTRGRPLLSTVLKRIDKGRAEEVQGLLQQHYDNWIAKRDRESLPSA